MMQNSMGLYNYFVFMTFGIIENLHLHFNISIVFPLLQHISISWQWSVMSGTNSRVSNPSFL